MGWVYVDDSQPAPAVQQRGGCVGIGLWGLLIVVVGVMVWVVVTDLGINFAITDGPPGMAVPTAAIRTRVVSPAPASSYSAPVPAAPAQSGAFETLPAPEPIAPVDAAPIPPVSADIQALPEYVAPEQASSEIPPDWEQSVFGEQPAPVEAAPVSEVAQPAPEGGVAPAEVSSEANEDWMEFMLSGGKPEDYTGD